MFFDADGKLIRGPASVHLRRRTERPGIVQKVYDGSKHTYFAAQDADTSWAGLQLAIPVRVSRILLHSRNDDNFVKPGDLYELGWWDRGQWYTMGRQVPDTYGLDYEGSSCRTPLLAEGSHRGCGRTDIYVRTGKQVWW